MTGLLKGLGGISASNFDQNGATTRVIFDISCDVIDLVVQYNPDIVWFIVLLHFLEGIHDVSWCFSIVPTCWEAVGIYRTNTNIPSLTEILWTHSKYNLRRRQTRTSDPKVTEDRMVERNQDKQPTVLW